jgi:integrase
MADFSGLYHGSGVRYHLRLTSPGGRGNVQYLWTPTVEGRPYAYYRRARRVIRIRASDGTPLLPSEPGFQKAYAAIHATFDPAHQRPTKAGPAPRSLSALILSYRQNEHWRELSPTTQRAYLRRFDMLEKAYGDASVPALDRVRVLAVQKHFQMNRGVYTPSRANEAMRALTILIEHSINIGWRTDNPVKAKALRTGDGHKMWTASDFAQFMVCEQIGDELKRTVVTAYYTGLRLGDLIALPRSARKNGVIVWTTQKTGAKVYIPEQPELTRWLDTAPVSDAATLLTGPGGRPWNRNTLIHNMRLATRLAGLPKLTMHGLRKGFVSRLAEAGSSDAEISALVPHSGAMTRMYRAQADQRILAARGMARLRDRSG